MIMHMFMTMLQAERTSYQVQLLCMFGILVMLITGSNQARDNQKRAV